MLKPTNNNNLLKEIVYDIYGDCRISNIGFFLIDHPSTTEIEDSPNIIIANKPAKYLIIDDLKVHHGALGAHQLTTIVVEYGYQNRTDYTHFKKIQVDLCDPKSFDVLKQARQWMDEELTELELKAIELSATLKEIQ